jgi:hypothetical protein
MTNPLSVRGAVAAATAVAAQHGVHCDEPRVMKHGANLIVHLAPAPVVARVAAVTAIVRPDPEAFLARDVALSEFAHRAGAAVVPPSDELPAGPHTRDGRVLTFFRYVEHERGVEAPRDLLGAAIAELHAVLAAYDGDLPYIGPVFGEVPDIVPALHERGVIDAAEVARYEERLAECTAALPAPGAPGEQALHGDAHRMNMLRTAHGLVWTDFEDSCRGSIAWDLVCARRSWPEALAAYPDRPSDAELAPFLAARELVAELWERIFAARDRGELGPMEP